MTEMTDSILNNKIATSFGKLKTSLAIAGVLALVVAFGGTFAAKSEHFLEKQNLENVRLTLVNAAHTTYNHTNSEVEYLFDIEKAMLEHEDWTYMNKHAPQAAKDEKKILTNRFYRLAECLTGKLRKSGYLKGEKACKAGAYDKVQNDINNVLNDIKANGVDLRSINQIEKLHNSIEDMWKNAIRSSNIASEKMADEVVHYLMKDQELTYEDIQRMDIDSGSLASAMNSVTWKNRNSQMKTDLLTGITRPGALKSHDFNAMRKSLAEANVTNYTPVFFAFFAGAFVIIGGAVLAYNSRVQDKAADELLVVEAKLEAKEHVLAQAEKRAKTKACTNAEGKDIKQLLDEANSLEDRFNTVSKAMPKAESDVEDAKAELQVAQDAEQEYKETATYRQDKKQLSELYLQMKEKEIAVDAAKSDLEIAKQGNERAGRIMKINKVNPDSSRNHHYSAEDVINAEDAVTEAKIALNQADEAHFDAKTAFDNRYNGVQIEEFEKIIANYDLEAVFKAQKVLEAAEAVVTGYQADLDAYIDQHPKLEKNIKAVRLATEVFDSIEEQKKREDAKAAALASLKATREGLKALIRNDKRIEDAKLRAEKAAEARAKADEETAQA